MFLVALGYTCTSQVLALECVKVTRASESKHILHILLVFRSWCHNLNVCVSIHWCCYQHYRSHSTHCSNSHSTLIASCRTGLTCCSPAGTLKTAVNRQTCHVAVSAYSIQAQDRLWYQQDYRQLNISTDEYI